MLKEIHKTEAEGNQQKVQCTSQSYISWKNSHLRNRGGVYSHALKIKDKKYELGFLDLGESIRKG